MFDIYYYIPLKFAEDAVDCGLKLSVWGDREVMIEGERRRCITGLLNPKDNMAWFDSQQLVCLKIDMQPHNCHIGDRILYIMGIGHPEAMAMYHGCIIPADKYIFGSFRRPECLITGTVIAGQISIADRSIDSPVICSDPEELYINNIMESCRENNGDFYDTALYYFLCRLAELKKADKIVDAGKKYAIFTDRRTGWNGRNYIVKMPEEVTF